jgi:hypothetical protein
VSRALFISPLEGDTVRCNLFIMGKAREGKFPILPSTTRRGTTLNTSIALDSLSVMIKLLSPPNAHATHTATSAESENAFDDFDDACTVLDKSGLLGPFLDTTIDRAKQIENTEFSNENTITHVSSPEPRGCSGNYLDETYIELDDDFIEEFHATRDASAMRCLLARRVVRYN